MSGPDGYPTDMEIAVGQLVEPLERIATALERIADGTSPRTFTEDELFDRSFDAAKSWERARIRASMTNAIGGQQTGRGVR